jgi:hypothetical protein
MKSDHPSSQSGGGVAICSAPKLRRRKWLYRTLWALLVLVASPCIYWYWCRHVALAERDALIVEIHARGEPVWWHEVVEKAEREQPEDNGAELFLQALTEFDAAYMRFPQSVKIVRDEREFLREIFEERKFASEVSEARRLAAAAFALAEAAVRRKPGLLTKNLRQYDLANVVQPHLKTPGLRKSIVLKTCDALTRNEPREAYHAVALAFRCAEHFRVDPLLIALVAGLSTRNVACDCLLECLARAAPTEGEFLLLDSLLAADDEGFEVNHVLVGERARFLGMVENDSELHDILLSWGRSARHYKGVDRWMYDGWLRTVASPAGASIRIRTQSDALRFTERFLPNVDRSDVDREGIGDALKEFNDRSPLSASLEDPPDFLYEWGWVSNKPLRLAHQRLIFTRLALRLRRHYDKHGRFPEKLDELCDAAMPKIRIDWFQNHPIVYKPTAKGFRLEVPEASVPTWEREHLKQTPLRTEYGLEFELKKLP